MSTSVVLPALGCDVRVNICGHDAKGGRSTGTGLRLLESSNVIASRKGSEISVDLLVDQRSQCALVAADGRLGEDVAKVDVTGFPSLIGGEVVNTVLKDLSVPAVEL